MYQSSRPRGDSPVSIIGAGIAGAWQALLFAQAGHAVTLYERSDAAMTLVHQPLGRRHAGALVRGGGVRARDRPARHPLARSVARAFSGNPVQRLAGGGACPRPRRFRTLCQTHHRPRQARRAGLCANSNRRWKAVFATGCSTPTKAMSSRGACCRNCTPASRRPAARSNSSSDADADDLDGLVIDCRGLAARDAQPELRGVKGEMIIVETSEVELSRPVRLIHPRWPLYVIPRGDNRFMLGATSIEAEDTGVSVRSALELLGAAYAVHPAFAEARIVEFGSGLRPAYPGQSAADRDQGREDFRQRALSPRLPAGAGAGGADARLCRSAA